MKILIALFFSFILLLSGCMNEFKFKAKNLDDSQSAPGVPGNEESRTQPDTGSPKPADPIMDPDRPVNIVYKAGSCSKNNFDILPCLSCQITEKKIDIPLSEKAKQLLQIMEYGCGIANKSDPAGYKAPTRSDLMKFLNRADENNYPSTMPTKRQKVNLEKWMNGDNKQLAKLFSGLFYNPPYSDDFETYFGIAISEARYLFCYQSPEATFSSTNVSPLYSIGFSQCYENGSSHCQERLDYIAANGFRKQLASTIDKSINDPFNDSELVPVNKCEWTSMIGNYNTEMESKLLEWKNKGYELVVYFENDRPRCEKLAVANIPLNTKVTIAGKLCSNF